MRKRIDLTATEEDILGTFGRRLRRARLRRGLSQDEVAARCGVNRDTLAALEAGRPTVTIGLMVKAMTVMGYPERIGGLLADDPMGEELESVRGRKRVGHVGDA